jgi:hypothetical protein
VTPDDPAGPGAYSEDSEVSAGDERSASEAGPNLHLLASRRSRCAEASFLAELERIRAMSIEERVKAALTLHEQFAWLAPAPMPGK